MASYRPERINRETDNPYLRITAMVETMENYAAAIMDEIAELREELTEQSINIQ